MAKKIVISDLVLKLTVDSGKALRGLKNLDKQLQGQAKKGKETAKRTQRDDAKSLKAGDKRVYNAKKQMASSRELYRLKNLSNTKFEKHQKKMIQSARANDGIEMARLKRKVGEELALDKTRRDNIAKRDLEARRSAKSRSRETKRQAVLERSLNRQRVKDRKFLQRTLSGAGRGGGMAMGMAGLGGGLAIAGATQQMLQFRRAEMSFKASMNVAGSTTDPDKMFKQIQQNADFYNINRARYLQTFGSTRAAIKADKLSDQELLYGQQGMAVASAISGTTQPQLDKAQYGLQQILTSGIQAQEIRQITENMASAAPAVYGAIGQLTGQEVSGMGQVRQLAEQGALAGIDPVDFFKVFTDILNKTYRAEFIKYQNSMPVVFDKMMQRFNNGVLAFAEGFDVDIKAVFKDITNVIIDNEPYIRAWGETFGKVTKQLWEIIKVVAKNLEPHLKRLSNSITSLDADKWGTIISSALVFFTQMKALQIGGELMKATTWIGKFASAIGLVGKVAGSGGGGGGTGIAGGISAGVGATAGVALGGAVKAGAGRVAAGMAAGFIGWPALAAIVVPIVAVSFASWAVKHAKEGQLNSGMTASDGGRTIADLAKGGDPKYMPNREFTSRKFAQESPAFANKFNLGSGIIIQEAFITTPDADSFNKDLNSALSY